MFLLIHVPTQFDKHARGVKMQSPKDQTFYKHVLCLGAIGKRCEKTMIKHVCWLDMVPVYQDRNYENACSLNIKKKNNKHSGTTWRLLDIFY